MCAICPRTVGQAVLVVAVWLSMMLAGYWLGHVIETTPIRVYYYDPSYRSDDYDARTDELWPYYDH